MHLGCDTKTTLNTQFGIVEASIYRHKRDVTVSASLIVRAKRTHRGQSEMQKLSMEQPTRKKNKNKSRNIKWCIRYSFTYGQKAKAS